MTRRRIPHASPRFTCRYSSQTNLPPFEARAIQRNCHHRVSKDVISRRARFQTGGEINTAPSSRGNSGNSMADQARQGKIGILHARTRTQGERRGRASRESRVIQLKEIRARMRARERRKERTVNGWPRIGFARRSPSHGTDSTALFAPRTFPFCDSKALLYRANLCSLSPGARACVCVD